MLKINKPQAFSLRFSAFLMKVRCNDIQLIRLLNPLDKKSCCKENKNMKYAVELYFDKKTKKGFWIWLKKFPVNLLK